MYRIQYAQRFRKDLRLCQKRGLDIEILKEVIELLSREGKLPAKYKPHHLQGNRAGQWECHIKPNWLLIWEQNDTELTLLMLATGTHADLFKK